MPTLFLHVGPRAALLAATAMMLLAPVGSGAQNRQAVFVHGFFSNGASWQQAADRIRAEYTIDAHRPDLQWSFRLGIQSGTLYDFMGSRGLPGNTLAFGHSNGGLISRRTNQLGRGMEGLMTVGTLHQGAPLAANVRNGNVFLWGQIVARDVAYAWNTYESYPYRSWYEELFMAALWPNAVMGNALGRSLPRIAQAVGWGTHNNPIEVTQDMVPGSAFVDSLNSGTNLTRETFALPYRIGVTSRLRHPYGITWKGIAPGAWAPLTSWQYGSAFAYWLAYEYYANYWDQEDPYYYDKQWNAWLWGRAAFTMVDMDPVWCAMIGAREGNTLCTGSDGIVPASSQFYPNATHYRDIHGPAHMEEKQSPQLEERLRDILGNVYGVPLCSTTPVTSFTVSPTSVTLQHYGSASLATISRNSCGNVVGGQSVSWRSSDATIVSVDSYGNVYGASPGTATITARHDATGMTSSSYVDVTTSDTGCVPDPNQVTCVEPYTVRPRPGRPK